MDQGKKLTWFGLLFCDPFFTFIVGVVVGLSVAIGYLESL